MRLAYLTLQLPWTSGPVQAVSLRTAPILGEEQQLHSAPDPARHCLGFGQMYTEHWQAALAGTHLGAEVLCCQGRKGKYYCKEASIQLRV